MSVFFDGGEPGSWRAALKPEAPACAACRQKICGHSDLVYSGVVPDHAAENTGG
jgi:hypothetical protein